MRQSEVMRMMSNRQKEYLRNWDFDGSAESEAMFNYVSAHNALYDSWVRRQELAELQDEASASSDNDSFSVSISSEVKTK